MKNYWRFCNVYFLEVENNSALAVHGILLGSQDNEKHIRNSLEILPLDVLKDTSREFFDLVPFRKMCGIGLLSSLTLYTPQKFLTIKHTAKIEFSRAD